MKVVAVDDEHRALNILRTMLEEVDGIESVECFHKPQEALEYIKTQSVDLVFMDVEMPGLLGTQIADTIKSFSRRPAVVFVTGYEEYSYEAWKLDAADYILKPFGLEELKHAVKKAAFWIKAEEDFQKSESEPQVYIQCSPLFAVKVDGKPIRFKSKKAEELLAFLVHYQGIWVSIDEIVFHVLEEKDEKDGKQYYRTILHRLKKELREAGIEDILETEYGKAKIKKEKFTCDYYDFIRGESETFRGVYMKQYSWAEEMNAYLLDKHQK